MFKRSDSLANLDPEIWQQVINENKRQEAGHWYHNIYISDLDLRSTPGVFHTCFYNHAHRTRLEKLF